MNIYEMKITNDILNKLRGKITEREEKVYLYTYENDICTNMKTL